jgi:hypothetical protein
MTNGNKQANTKNNDGQTDIKNNDGQTDIKNNDGQTDKHKKLIDKPDQVECRCVSRRRKLIPFPSWG